MTTTGNRAAPAVGGEGGADALGPVGLAEVAELAHRIAGNVAHVLVGKPEVVRLAIIAVLAEGHLLIEDVPGIGKTVLAKSLARTVDSTVSRVQFTPDLLPSDVTGVSIYDRQSAQFEFRPGPIFANIVSPTRSTGRRPRPSPRCWSAWRNGRSPSTAPATDWPGRSWSSPPRTRSRWRARTRCPRRSGTGSWHGSPSATPTATPRSACSPTGDRTDPLETLRPVTDAATVSRG